MQILIAMNVWQCRRMILIFMNICFFNLQAEAEATDLEVCIVNSVNIYYTIAMLGGKCNKSAFGMHTKILSMWGVQKGMASNADLHLICSNRHIGIKWSLANFWNGG